jgi:hypothetical protein
MKILTATARTQGQRPGDFNWCTEGELVTPRAPICDRDMLEGPDGDCGCGRSFGGLRSHKSGTTAMVRDLGIGLEDVAFIARKAGTETGMLALSPNPDGDVADEAAAIARAAEPYPVGTVLEIRMGEISVREQGTGADPFTDPDIDGLAKFAYDRGEDPLDYAIGRTATFISINATVIAARAKDPASFPGYPLDASPEMVARRIIGTLLDSGWTPPEVSRD